MQEAARMLADSGYIIKGGNFDTLDDFISYYEIHGGGTGARFLVDDIEALFGIELADPREVAATLDALTA